MDNKNKLEELFKKIDLDNIDESLIEEVPKEEIFTFENIFLEKNIIKEEYKLEPFGNSELAGFVFLFVYKIQNIGPPKTQDELNLFCFISNFCTQYSFDKPNNFKKWNKLYELINSFNKENKIEETNFFEVQKIYSEFFDYYLLNTLKNSYYSLNYDIKNQFNNIILDFVVSLKNASSFWDIKMKDVNDFTGKKAISQIKNKFLSVYLTPDFMNDLLTIVGKYQELDDKVFNNSLNGEILMEFADLVERFNLLESIKFDKTKEVFQNMTTIKHRKKMLLMHEILVLFEHPLALSLEKEEEFFKINENSSKQSLLQRQIRIAEQVLCIS